MKAPSGFLIIGALAVAACTPNQTGRPVTQASVGQPQAAMQSSGLNPTPLTRASIEEMSRTRGPGWVRTASNNDGGYYYAHEPTIVFRENTAISWILFNFWNSSRNNDGFVRRSTLYRSEYDCVGRRFRISDLQNFSGHGASGQSQFVGGTSDWRAIVPGSFAERSMEFACRRGTQARPPSDTTSRPPQTPGRLGPPKDPV
jgi:hypothetical protein